MSLDGVLNADGHTPAIGSTRPGFEEVLARPAWMKDGACNEYPLELFFPTAGQTDVCEQARAVCAGCLVLEECLAWALSWPPAELFGVWGGTTQTERRALRKRRQTMTDEYDACGEYGAALTGEDGCRSCAAVA